MSYKEMVMDLKQEKKDIIFIKNGAFYIAIGNDAIVLNQILQLKCTCFSKGICKVGVPIASINKYTSKLKESNYNYSVYELKEDKETEELKLELNNKTQIFKSSQGVNYCGYKINEYRLKIREKGKRKLKKKVKELKYKIKIGAISSKDAKRYIAGHLGYIKIANTYNIEKNLFEI